MSKKQPTETERLITFAMTADASALGSAIESLTAIRDTRFPKAESKPPKQRKPRSDSGKPRGLPKADTSNGADSKDTSDAH